LSSDINSQLLLQLPHGAGRFFRSTESLAQLLKGQISGVPQLDRLPIQVRELFESDVQNLAFFAREGLGAGRKLSRMDQRAVCRLLAGTLNVTAPTRLCCQPAH
jgi:hypothetical protein